MKIVLSYLLAGIFLISTSRAAPVSDTLRLPRETSTDLFASDEILEIKLSGPLRDLFDDRRDAPTYFPAVISYLSKDSTEVKIPIRTRTRGNFRRARANCDYPPILLNFDKATNKSTFFENQNKIKLVTPCQNESYIFREWLVYKLYNLLTPKSFRARLVRIECFDTKKKKELPSFYGILLEDEKAMAKRNNMLLLENKTQGEYTDPETYLKMAVFQYMIGNCDWSVPFLHNTKLISADSVSAPHVVPYDFDHAGIVEAHYANPPEGLGLESTKERRYRGYCVRDTKAFDPVVDLFNSRKKEIYKLYTDCPYLSAKYIKSTTNFLDQFYQTINNQKKLTAAIGYPCTKGYVNVVVKGLNDD